jgi:hypothetical protein
VKSCNYTLLINSNFNKENDEDVMKFIRTTNKLLLSHQLELDDIFSRITFQQVLILQLNNHILNIHR